MDSDAVQAHYAARDLEATILSALTDLGRDLTALTPDDLAMVDEFHIRGREATDELVDRVDIQPHHRILDVGSGLGGSARYLSHRFGCSVDGVDLTEAYCQVAASLTERLGLGDRTRFHAASATDMPFDAGTFDVVWTEHVQMNIEDKHAFYAEIARVLKPGGRLLFHDIFRGKPGELRYPVPWAGDPSISFLAGTDTVRRILEDLGVSIDQWDDRTAPSLAWFKERVAAVAEKGPPPLGIHLLMGGDATTKFQNLVWNLERERLAVIQAVGIRE